MKSAYVTEEECASALGMEVLEFREYVEAGLLPCGFKRLRGHSVWRRMEIKFMIWLEENRHRFVGGGLEIDDIPRVPASKRQVYFIQELKLGSIKIGSSANPMARLASLRTGNASELQLLGVIPGGAKRERELHQQFAEHRLEGEWFSSQIVHMVTGLIMNEGMPER